MADAAAPGSFPVAAGSEPIRRRAVFSASFGHLDSHHALSPDDAAAIRSARRRRKVSDDSLRLIDDLVNRPMDSMYQDARLVRAHRSTLNVWATRVIVFIICVAVGFAGSLFVQQLQSDPRKQVRTTLAGQLTDKNGQIRQLGEEVDGLRNQIDEQSKKISGSIKSKELTEDEMVNGTVAVRGEGITMTLADPIAAGQNESSSNRVGTDTKIKVVTDLDLQQLVSLMFRFGAEAISINGNRLGAQTSIRKAGGHILIGLNAIESPYTIEAIGDKNALAEAMGEKNLAGLYQSFKEAGIYPQVSKSNSITLKAAVASDIQYAERNK